MDDMWINAAVGAELRAARARRGWTRAELAEKSGVTEISIRRYESGTRSVPVDTLVALICALGLPLSDIERAIRAAKPGSRTQEAAKTRRRDASDIRDRIPRPTKRAEKR